MPNILDKAFRYTPASQTDLKKTFARVRREQLKREQEQAQRRPVVEMKRKQGVGK